MWIDGPFFIPASHHEKNMPQLVTGLKVNGDIYRGREPNSCTTAKLSLEQVEPSQPQLCEK